MKSIEILALGVRVVGIIFVLQILGFLAQGHTVMQMIYFFNQDMDARIPWLMFYVVVGLIWLVTSFVLIRYPVAVAYILLPRTGSDEPVFNGSIDDLTTAAFTVLGIYILTWAIPDLFQHAGSLLLIKSERMANLYDENYLHSTLVTGAITIVEIGIGVFLCLQAKGLGMLLRKFRSM